MNEQNLELAMGSDDPEERRRAVASIADAKENDRPRLLIRALGDRDWRVRKEAVGVGRGLASRDVIDALVDVLRAGDNVGLRNAAVESLGGFGSLAVDALAVAVPSLDADGRKLAAEALARSRDAASLEVLETMLEDDDVNVRTAAIEAIAAVGGTDVDRAASLLERCLLTDDPLSALAALEGLNHLGARVAWPMLKPHLGNPVLREALLTAAGLSGHADAAPYLVRALSGGDGRGFIAATRALATLVVNDSAAYRAARTALSSLGDFSKRALVDQVRAPRDDLETRRCLLLVVGVLGTTEAAGAVIDALSDDRIAAEAEQALDMLGPAAILALARRTGTGSSEERAKCVEQLGRLADESTRSVACRAIIDATEEQSPEVVRAALVALGRIGDESTLGLAGRWLVADAPPAIRQAAGAALATCAKSYPEAARSLARQSRPDGSDAAFAASVIGVIDGPVFEGAGADVAFLAEAASNESPLVRRTVLEALSRSVGPEAVRAVSFALTDEVPEVRLAAIRALGRMRDQSGRAVGVTPLLGVVDTFGDDMLGVAAIDALGETLDPDALPVLRKLAREAEAMRAVAAVEAIGRIDAPGRVDALIHALSHSEPEVVKAALRAVAREDRDPRAAAHVAACLDHEVWDVRRLAAELLGRRTDPTAKHLLRQRLIGEREPLVREAIQRSLVDADGATLRRTVPPLGGGAG
jgi:HEAT repeat protein